MVTFDGGEQSLDLQNEFIGIKEWTCDPSSLGLTPKEIEKRLNSTTLHQVVHMFEHVFL